MPPETEAPKRRGRPWGKGGAQTKGDNPRTARIEIQAEPYIKQRIANTAACEGLSVSDYLLKLHEEDWNRRLIA